jgi:hypothetical protein
LVEIPSIQLDNLSAEQREGLALGFKVTLASVLGLSVDEVKILGMRRGSVILEVNLPSEAIKTLQDLPITNLEQELGIRVWVGRQVDPEHLVKALESKPRDGFLLSQLQSSWNMQRRKSELQPIVNEATVKLVEGEEAEKWLEWTKILVRRAKNIMGQATGALETMRQLARPKRWWLPQTKRDSRV